jgi:hypothetical protein
MPVVTLSYEGARLIIIVLEYKNTLSHAVCPISIMPPKKHQNDYDVILPYLEEG